MSNQVTISPPSSPRENPNKPRRLSKNHDFKIPEMPHRRKPKPTEAKVAGSEKPVTDHEIVVSTPLMRRVSDSVLTHRKPGNRQIIPYNGPVDFQQLVSVLSNQSTAVLQVNANTYNYYNYSAPAPADQHIPIPASPPVENKKRCPNFVSAFFHPAVLLTTVSGALTYVALQTELTHLRSLVKFLIEKEILGRTLYIFDTEIASISFFRFTVSALFIIGILSTCYICFREILRLLGIREY